MTGRQQPNPGDLVATRAQDHGHGSDLQDVTVAARVRELLPDPSVAPESTPEIPPSADLSNVIPFGRAHRAAAEPGMPPLMLDPQERPAPPPSRARNRFYLALLAVSVAVHGTLLAVFWQEPKPLASIGVEVISVEIVIGATTAAGLTAKPGEAPVDAPAIDEVKPDDQLVEVKEQRTTEAPQEVPVAEREVAPDHKPEEEQPSEQQPEPQPQLAMVETPRAEVSTALPRETPAEMNAIIVPPVERSKPNEPKPAAEKPKPKPPVQKQERAPERKRIAAKTAEQPREEARPKPSTPQTAASGIGRGRSDNSSNYAGIVRAHLIRHKRDLPGSRGTGVLSFTIDGSGRVVSASVVRSTGSPNLDQELAAMPRRASPFPAPPSGRSIGNTVQVTFN
jgi:periplasmic protein TonB